MFVIAEQNNVTESHNEKWKAILHYIQKPLDISSVFFLRLLFSSFVTCKTSHLLVFVCDVYGGCVIIKNLYCKYVIFENCTLLV